MRARTTIEWFTHTYERRPKDHVSVPLPSMQVYTLEEGPPDSSSPSTSSPDAPQQSADLPIALRKAA
jgi:hypothetical protein